MVVQSYLKDMEEIQLFIYGTSYRYYDFCHLGCNYYNHHIDKTNDISLQRKLTLNTYFSYYHYQNPLTQLSKICTLVATFTTWITNYKSLLEDSIFNRYLPRLLLV